MKKLVSSLKACQLCHYLDHTAGTCTNLHLVQMAENFVTEEVSYSKDVYRNPNQSYQPKSVHNPNWERYHKGQRGQAHEQGN